MGRVMAAGFVVMWAMAMGPGSPGIVGVSAGQAPAGGAKQAKPPALTSAQAKALKNPAAADAASIEAGRVTFAKFCRACHGPEGKGDGPAAAAMKDVKPSNLADAKWEHGSTDGEIFNTIHAGVGPKFAMAAFQGRIPDPQIWNVVNYVKTLSKTAK
jgi:mono/diheme cytochrome c family protein